MIKRLLSLSLTFAALTTMLIGPAVLFANANSPPIPCSASLLLANPVVYSDRSIVNGSANLFPVTRFSGSSTDTLVADSEVVYVNPADIITVLLGSSRAPLCENNSYSGQAYRTSGWKRGGSHATAQMVCCVNNNSEIPLVGLRS